MTPELPAKIQKPTTSVTRISVSEAMRAAARSPKVTAISTQAKSSSARSTGVVAAMRRRI